MKNIKLRAATIDDSHILLMWANSADSLKWKKNTQELISSEHHEQWLKTSLSNKETALWMILRAEQPIGQVRLEKKIDGVHADIYLSEDNRGKGYAKTALNDAIDIYCDFFGPQKFIAVVHKNNKKSQNLFAKNFFKAVDKKNCEWLHFTRTVEFQS